MANARGGRLHHGCSLVLSMSPWWTLAISYVASVPRLRFMVGLLIVFAACGTNEQLERFDAPTTFALPLQITGTGQHDLWAVVDPAASKSPSATVAQSRDGGKSWRSFAVPQISSSFPVQIESYGEGRIWILGTALADRPGLVLVTRQEDDVAVVDFTMTFPVGTTDVVLRVEGFRPDAMITARLPSTTKRSLFLFSDHPLERLWKQFQLPTVDLEIAAVMRFGIGYFFFDGRFSGCVISFDQFGQSWGCREFFWPAEHTHDDVYLAENGIGEWLWWPDTSGGLLFDNRTWKYGGIEPWPEDHRPVRFVTFRDGYRGVVAVRSSSTFVFVSLDPSNHVLGEVELADCDGACDVEPRAVTRLPDGSLLIVGREKWFFGAVALSLQ